MTTHTINKLAITAYFTGDLSAQKHGEVENHLRDCPECLAYYKSLGDEKLAFLTKYPFDSVPVSPAAKIINFPSVKYLYALAASLVLVVTASIMYSSLSPMDTFRSKGGDHLSLVVKTVDGAVEKRQSACYYPGESIQFIYSKVKKGDFILMGIDEHGTLSTYFPGSDESSITLQPGADIPLPNSILLDNYIGQEMFMAFFSEKKMSVMPIKESILTQFKKTGKLEKLRVKNTGDYSIQTILITKCNRQL